MVSIDPVVAGRKSAQLDTLGEEARFLYGVEAELAPTRLYR